MINLKHVGAIATVLLIAGVGAISYFVGKGQSEAELAAAKKEVEALKADEKEAAVVKRVSQQMEEIAYQQKEISDKQRDKAEESSKLAIQMRDRAEQESKLAHEAENKAVAALEEARVQRTNAERQQEIAVEQRDKATLSKTIADTLNYRTQARALGLTSINSRKGDDIEVSNLLAYASWYFLDKYKGNTYSSETFKALDLAANGTIHFTTPSKGAVNALCMIPDGEGRCVAATNYGEIEIFSAQKEKGTHTILLQDKSFDFRDIWAGKKAVYALAFQGSLCVVEYDGHLKTVELPADAYFKMLRTDSNTLLLAGRKSLCWYTFSTGEVSAPVKLAKTLSAIVKREKAVCLFFDDGSYAEMNGTGTVTEKTPIAKRMITAAHYAPDLECLCLGTKEGTILLINKYNRTVEYLNAHKAKATDICTVDAVLVSSAYDKAAYIWKLDNLLFNTGLTFWQEMQAQVAPIQKETYDGKQAPNTWLSPVEYTYSGWTLSVCGDAETKYAWIGTSTGEVVRMNISVDNMAKKVQSMLKRNLTPTEWSRFMGASVPYIKFKE